MNMFELIARTLQFALRLVLWTVAALLSLAMVSVLLVALLSWALVSLALGRKPNLAMRGRFERVRQFSGAFGSARFKAGATWPRQAGPSHETPLRPTDAPLSRRISPSEGVVDVEARDLTDKRQDR
jgi:hypothetical protein